MYVWGAASCGLGTISLSATSAFSSTDLRPTVHPLTYGPPPYLRPTPLTSQIRQSTADFVTLMAWDARNVTEPPTARRTCDVWGVPPDPAAASIVAAQSNHLASKRKPMPEVRDMRTFDWRSPGRATAALRAAAVLAAILATTALPGRAAAAPVDRAPVHAPLQAYDSY